VLDLIRLAEDRWLARAFAVCRDGTTAVLEKVLQCRDVPHVEAVVDARDDHTLLVLRERHDPARVLAARAIERAPLRLVWDAARPSGPRVPA
jgi:hypothetical protein